MLTEKELQEQIVKAQETTEASKKNEIALQLKLENLQSFTRLKNCLPASENIAKTMTDQELGALARTFTFRDVIPLIESATCTTLTLDFRLSSRSLAAILAALKRHAGETQDASDKKDKEVQNETE